MCFRLEATVPARFRSAAILAACAATLLLATTACSRAAATNPAQSGGKPGALGGSNNPSTAGQSQSPNLGTPSPSATADLTGSPIVLASNADFSGDDAVTDAAGTAFIGWISDSNFGGRKVSLCVLPKGATNCAGGVSTVDSLGDSTATGLRVLLTGPHTVTLVWQYVTAASESGPEGDEIAVATSSGGPLSAAHNVATAPSFGAFRDAVVGPDGTIWVASEVAGGKLAVQIRPGFANPPVNVKTPYLIGYAQLRFAGTMPVLVIDKDGSIGGPISVATEHGGKWSDFRNVANVWTTANFGLASTPSGLRLIATTDNATYQPVVANWTGSAFATPALTGDTNACAPSSHDPVSDASGRLADVSMECGDVAIANLPDTEHATVYRFPVNGTFAGTVPQLTTSPDGSSWVTWSIESKGGDQLMATPLLLPGQ
jgi:hypothetical protein